MRKDCQRYQRLKEILGKRFGKLIANGFIKRGKKTLVKCKCDCGKQCLAYPGNLRAGNNQSCGIRKRHLVSSVCKQCKKEFKKTRHSMFCSDFCMNRSHQGYRGPEEKECLWCGKKFTNLKANKYCCAECRERHRWQGIYEQRFHETANAIQGEKAMQEAILCEIQSMSIHQLHEELAKGLKLTIESLTRTAMVWRELESRGADLSKYKVGITRSLPLIAKGMIAPEAVIAFAGRPGIAKHLLGMNIDDQKKYADGEPIPVYVPGQAEPELIPLAKIPHQSLNYVLCKGEIRTPQEQKLARYSKTRQRANGSRRKFYRVSVDIVNRAVKIGKSSATIETVVTELCNACSPGEVTESKDRPAKVIAGKVTDEEKDRLLAASKAHGIPESEMVRRAVIAMWLL